MLWIFLTSFLSGALLPLAFAPFHVYSVSFILPAILLCIWLRTNAKMAFWTGLLFGVGFFGVGSSWIYISIHQFGNSSAPLAAFITFLFIVWMALYPATLGYVFRTFFSRQSVTKQCLLFFPALWVSWEYLRSVLFTGFPWLLLGYAQLSNPLRGLAPIIGVFGLSLVTTLISGALVLLATRQTQFVKIISFVIIFGLVGIGWSLVKHPWTKPAGEPLQASLIQGNIPQSIKWDRDYLIKNITVYADLTKANWSSKLIVWPEGALPVYTKDATGFIDALSHAAKQHHSNVIFGAPIVDEKTNQYYNGLVMVGDNHGQYLKRHLVPWGEYIPLQFIFAKAMRYFNIPMSEFSFGPPIQPDFKINHIRIAPFICYEITFPNEVLNAANHSELLLTASDDSWFGRSIALAQHLEMAEMRSLETQRPQLVSTNTGITAFISPFGKMIKGAPINQRTVITATIQPMSGKTPLMRWHYYPILGLIILMLLMVFVG